MTLNLAYLVLLGAYVVTLFFGPDLDTSDGIEFQVAAQKIMVYASVALLGLQAVGVLQAARRQAPRSALA